MKNHVYFTKLSFINNINNFFKNNTIKNVINNK